MKAGAKLVIVTMCFLIGSVNNSFLHALVSYQSLQSLLDPKQALAQAMVIRVPQDASSLQNAINQISDGGIIELSAGTYYSPVSPSGPAYDGFTINNLQKSLTIRAKIGDQVILDGAGQRPIFRNINSSLQFGKPILLEGITFANGRSNYSGLAGGITIQNSQVTFDNCTLSNNYATQNGVGGAALVAENSTAFFFNTTFVNNSAMNFGGGLVVAAHSKVYIHASNFTNNRVNLPGHPTWAAGGAIHTGNSVLRISNTRFENNQAGYVGGALYAIGTWGDPVTTDILIANSTFINNRAINDPSVNLTVPTEGGGFLAEAQTTARIYNSRFINNQAMAGGAMNLYQSDVTIEDSVFLGNRATGTGNMGGYGGAIGAGSNDTPADGNINRRSAQLTIRNSFIQGRYGTTTLTGQGGGGVFIAGDINRTRGTGGVTQMGTAAQNRANLTIDKVIFSDLDVQGSSSGGMGGAILTDLANLTLSNSLIMGSDAIGTNSSGGGVAVIDQSATSIVGTTFVKNSTNMFGGGIYASGSDINIGSSNFVENINSNANYGSAIFTAVDQQFNLNMTGSVHDNKISNNVGTPIFDDDRTNGPINTVVYNSNQFFPGGSNAVVYSDSLFPYKTVTGLNSLVVTRNNNTSTDKSQTNNIGLNSIPIIAYIMASPSQYLLVGAVADPAPQSGYLGYGWSGGSAAFDGNAVSGNMGAFEGSIVSSHTLSVNGNLFTANITQAPLPWGSFDVTGSGPSYYINWSVVQGTFLECGIDMGVSIPSAISGSVLVSPPVEDMTYRFYAITRQGGIMLKVTTNQKTLNLLKIFEPFITRLP